MKLRINEKEFPLLSARAATENMNGHRRDVISLTITATNWWLRSPYTLDTLDVWGVFSRGDYEVWLASDSYGVRPALVLPSDFQI